MKDDCNSTPDLSIDFNLPIIRSSGTNCQNQVQSQKGTIRLYVENRTGALASVVSPLTLARLQQDYLDGSLLGVPMGDPGVGEHYLNEFVARVLQLRPQRVLDVACGTGKSSISIAAHGIEVVGIDPFLKYRQTDEPTGNINLIAGLFPADLGSNLHNFDATVSHAFLEHCDDPVAILEDMAARTRIGGTILVAVPDCSYSIRQADVSMILHEHRSYFDSAALMNTALVAGLRDISVSSSMYGGVLYLTASVSKADATGSGQKTCQHILTPTLAQKSNLLKFSQMRSRIQLELEKFESSDELRLVYVPHRLVNFIDKPLRALPIDDSSNFHGQYISGFQHPIQPLEAIRDTPEAVLIASHSFRKLLETKVKKRWPGVRVISLTDLLESCTSITT